jgi:hypothetical protein
VNAVRGAHLAVAILGSDAEEPLMLSTRMLCVLTCLALTGCGETRIVLQGTSESPSTAEPGRQDVPSIDLSTEPAVSLIEQYDGGTAPPLFDLTQLGRDAGVNVVDAAMAEPEPELEPEPAPEPEEPVLEPEELAPAPQVEQCGFDMSCDFKCTNAACAMGCDDANNCKVDCGEISATCDVSCRGANNCELRCRSGSCEFDCTDANNCDHLKCEDGAACLARCTGAGNCEWEDCDEPSQCAGDIIACNRECP